MDVAAHKGRCMKSATTMHEIACSFLELSNDAPADRITVGNIVGNCGKNRKTFYYHFIDKEHLVLWIFRRDLGELLREEYDEGQLVSQNTRTDGLDEEEPYRCFPYYVHNEVGFCSLDHAGFFRCFAEALDLHRSIYAQLLDGGRFNLFRNHLFDLYIPVVRNDAYFILGNRYLKPKNVVFIADFYTTAFINTFVQVLQDPRCVSIAAAIEPQENLIHDSIRRELEERRLNRKM